MESPLIDVGPLVAAIHSLLKLTASLHLSLMVVGQETIDPFLFGFRFLFPGDMLVLGRVYRLYSK